MIESLKTLESRWEVLYRILVDRGLVGEKMWAVAYDNPVYYPVVAASVSYFAPHKTEVETYLKIHAQMMGLVCPLESHVAFSPPNWVTLFMYVKRTAPDVRVDVVG